MIGFHLWYRFFFFRKKSHHLILYAKRNEPRPLTEVCCLKRGSKMNSGELENVTVKKTLAGTDQTT